MRVRGRQDRRTGFEQWKAALNAIMPAGIVITRWPGADEGRPHCLRMLSITYPGGSGCGAGCVHNALEKRPVKKHGKKGNKIIELKEHLPKVEYTTEGDSLHMDLCMPAAQELNLNPSLLTGFLEEKFGLPRQRHPAAQKVFDGR